MTSKSNDELLCRALQLNEEIGLMKQELAAIDDELSGRAFFEAGKATAYVEGTAVKAKVVRRTNDRWDQEKLNRIRLSVGDTVFMKGFRYSWDDRGKKAIEAMAAGMTEEQKEMLSSAVTTTTRMKVTYEEVGADA